MVTPEETAQVAAQEAAAKAATQAAAPASSQQNASAAQQVPIQELLREREKRQSLQAELESLRTTMAQPQQVQQQFQAQPLQPQADPRVAQLEQMWEQNPRQAIQTEIGMAIEWLDKVNTSVDLQLDATSKKYQDFAGYQPKVKEWLRQLPIAQRSREGVVELAYHALKGQSIDDVIKRVQEETIAKMKAGESVQGFAPGSVGGDSASTTLTDQERNVAAIMGIKEEDYIKHKPKAKS